MVWVIHTREGPLGQGYGHDRIGNISPLISTGYKERYGSFSNIGSLGALFADELSLVYLFPQQSTYPPTIQTIHKPIAHNNLRLNYSPICGKYRQGGVLVGTPPGFGSVGRNFGPVGPASFITP